MLYLYCTWPVWSASGLKLLKVEFSPRLFKNLSCDQFSMRYIELFRKRLSDIVHATIPKGIVGGFELTVLQRNLGEWHERPWAYVWLLKESNNSRLDSYSVRNSVLVIFHITRGFVVDCREHIFSTTFPEIIVKKCVHLKALHSMFVVLLTFVFRSKMATPNLKISGHQRIIGKKTKAQK